MKHIKKMLGTAIAALALAMPAPFAEGAPAYADSSLRHLPLAARTYYFSEGDKDGELLRTHWTQVDFLGDKNAFKNIAKALSDYNKQQDAQTNRKTRKQLADEARYERNERKKYGATHFGPFEDTTDIFFRRTDSLAVTFLESGYTYQGGVHGMYGVIGRNFDANTGKELHLDDVIADRKGMAEAIKTQLRFDYPTASFAESSGTLMEEMVDEQMTKGTIHWTLDPWGISFYFNPYLIGSYAEGIFTTTILFSEHPTLFRQDGYHPAPCWRGPDSYAVDLISGLPLRLSDSPRGDRLAVYNMGDKINIVYCGETLTDPIAAKDFRPVFVQLADDRRYLYADYSLDGKNYQLRVYDLNGTEPTCIGTQAMTRLASPPDQAQERKWYVLTDPGDFLMTSTGGGFTPEKWLRCRIGADGRIEVYDAEDAVG